MNDMEYLKCIIKSGLFDEINEADYLKAFEGLRVSGKNMRKDEVVFYEDDKIDKICIINKGSIRGEKTYVSGEMHIIDFYEEGKIFALEESVSKLRTSAMDYICNEDSSIVYISLKAIKALFCSDRIMEVLMRKLADENIRKMYKIEILAERSLRGRILLYFNVLRKKSGSNTVHVNMGREQLARFLCVNRSALSNELNKMKREGIIDFSKHDFTLL